MSLSDALKDSVFEGLTDAECVAKFGETVEVSRDNTSHTLSSLNLALLDIGVDLSVVSSWDQTVSNMTGGSMMLQMLGGSGIDFTLQPVRDMIKAAITASEDQNIKTFLGVLLQVGIKTGPRWEKHGLAEEPTEAEVTAARQVIQNERDAASLMNECINPLMAQKASLAEIKTAVAAWGE